MPTFADYVLEAFHISMDEKEYTVVVESPTLTRQGSQT
jgi:hypothetical protein